MNNQLRKIQISLGVLIFGLAGMKEASGAAAFSVVYNENIPFSVENDEYYKATQNGQLVWDGISSIFHSDVTTTDSGYNLVSSLFGRHYDSDPTNPGEWGLLNRAGLLPGSPNEWIVKHGLPPVAIGSSQYDNLINGEMVLQPASYIAFTVSSDSGEGLLFEAANLSITGFYNVDGDVDVWATTNQDGYTTVILPTVSISPESGTDIYSFDFGALNLVGAGLEVRVYGVLGQDQGSFTSAALSGSVGPFPVPEPTGLLFGGMAVLGMGLRRRR